ncbi:MAG: tetraacyldisaccharide 4'-kinase [Candidatus Wallbacteria bacterium]|nr:tetraacyldisaccharide 4'-kinase [Candidatus Wallbacteria bacterium]
MVSRSWLIFDNPFFQSISSRLYFGLYLLDRFYHSLRYRKVNRPVISIGNLHAGGTGKTTLTAEIGEYLTKKGLNIVILSRGYKAGLRGNHKLEPGADPDQYGDEPVMLAERTGIPVLIGKNRLAGLKRYRQLKPDCLLLDDGFQYYRLHRDLDILTIDSTSPMESYQLLPTGLLREPLTAFRRARVAVLTRCELADPAWLIYLEGLIRGISPGIRIFRACTAVRCWKNLNSETVQPPAEAESICGIGNPESFDRLLSGSGIKLAGKRVFPDHHKYSKADLSGLSGQTIVTTEKDAVKLKKIAGSISNIIYPQIGFDLPAEFYELIMVTACCS